MSGRKRKGITLVDYNRWAKQGYGAGERESYKPWIRVQDFASRGVSARVPGITIRRTHHLLSRLELRAFLFFDFKADVIDIREQFPLFPLPSVLALAKQLEIRYPHHSDTKVPVVLTSDFLLTLRNTDGKLHYVAVECKLASELTPSRPRVLERTLEKLELKRRYWASLGVDFKLFTENSVSDTCFKNLRVLNEVAAPNAELRSKRTASRLMRTLGAINWLDKPLRELISEVALGSNLSWDHAFEVFKFMVWHDYIRIDLEEPLLRHRPLATLEIVPRDVLRTDLGRRKAA
jgi:hypothetical protein